MELLFGALTAVLVEVGKKIVDRFGYKVASLVILGSAFILSVGFSLLTVQGIITKEMITSIAVVWASSVATYEIILKRILPIYGQIFSPKTKADEEK